MSDSDVTKLSTEAMCFITCNQVRAAVLNRFTRLGASLTEALIV